MFFKIRACYKKYQKLINGGRLLEPLEYKLREEKDANCEKLYCCGRKSCESGEIFLATFSYRNVFFPQQFLAVKYHGIIIQKGVYNKFL